MSIASTEQHQKLLTNQKLRAATMLTEALDFTAVFAAFLHPYAQFAFALGAKFVMYPIAAVANIVLAILAWREAYLERSNRSYLNAAVYTAAAVAITIAVIGTLAAGVIFSLARPIIFTATVGSLSIYHAGSALYSLFHSTKSDQAENKKEHLQKATEEGINAIGGMIATAVIASIFLFGKIVIAGLGVALGSVATIYAVYVGVKAHRESKALQPANNAETDSAHDNGVKNTCGLFRIFGKSSAITAVSKQPANDDIIAGVNGIDKPVELTSSVTNQIVETTSLRPSSNF